jgi:hypothetical protein
LATILGRSSISLWLIVFVIIIEYFYFWFLFFDSFLFLMTIIVTRQPNIEHGLKDQTNIALTLFNTILETANTRVELERSWAAIERDISVQERWEARQRHLRNQL